MRHTRRPLLPLALLLAAAGGSVLLALMLGSETLSPRAVADALRGTDTSFTRDIVVALRLPRALAALACGALLALSGALLQALLRNPLAEPYVLGVSSGASVGALTALWLGASAGGTSAGASAGALGATALVFLLGARAFRRHADSASASVQLLLVGVIVAAGFSAVVAFILSIAPEGQLRGMVFWLLGDLNGVERYGVALTGAVALLAAALLLARDLNLMLLGDGPAEALGVPVQRLRIAVVVLASVAAGLAISVAGSIGFVGLVVPHALRLALGNDQRVLLPACALGGGAFLVLADTLARTLAAPMQLPVGVLTAFIGVPAFLWLLLRQGGRT
ncbi:FecCD family ABC transporter permease [Caldimonas thermodepolymerans]|uniref:Iron complex transport system permease protein n=1 Tax=Caldimonas thermodepolymerans TaxID=215580 RepID=A0AA46DHV6_9BURK|nr:iron ABC transporter permease [Caldimonas thermodepolymerans]TCP10098.1 iron complex transport system permease protein [Caldimonas thermodepolymerans]UZG46476.1 iron ABC transporter permease [Caldimonas thermodepolymerans]